MQRLNKKFSAIALTALILSATQPAFGMAPPPATNMCILSPEVCHIDTAADHPDFHMKVNGADIVRNNTVIDLGSADVNGQTRVQVGYFDKNNKFDATTDCTANRVLSTQDITVSGQGGFTPWDTAELLHAPISFGSGASQQSPVIFSKLPKGHTSTMRLRISCVHENREYMKQITLTADGQPLPGSFSFTSTDLPIIPSDSTTQNGHPYIGWILNGDVGTCQITVPPPGNSPGSWFNSQSYSFDTWSSDSYIQSHELNGSSLESAPTDLLFRYPSAKGTVYTYRLALACSKVDNNTPKTIVLTAERRSDSGGAGAGKTYNYSDGSTRFE